MTFVKVLLSESVETPEGVLEAGSVHVVDQETYKDLIFSKVSHTNYGPCEPLEVAEVPLVVEELEVEAPVKPTRKSSKLSSGE